MSNNVPNTDEATAGAGAHVSLEAGQNNNRDQMVAIQSRNERNEND